MRPCLAASLAFALCLAALSPAFAEPKSVAFLGVQFLNDHEAEEPTSAAERARLESVVALFKQKLEASGRYGFTPLPPETAENLAKGANIGSCGGCEYGYGREAHAELIAWLVVQKVSNLILNINVYIGDVAGKRLSFVHSVDIRGNTDESWTRGMNYLVKNYVLADPPR
jgi:hypothetical protein